MGYDDDEGRSRSGSRTAHMDRYRSGRDDRDSRERDHHRRSMSPPPFSGGTSARKRSRGFRFDSPPKPTDMKMTTSMSSVLSQAAAAVPGATSTAMPSDVSALAMMRGATSEEVKQMREVYVGNFQSSVTSSQLADFLGSAMAALHMNISPGSPMVRAWTSSDGQFIFMELRTIEEANNCVELSGIKCCGHDLVIGRTKGYPTSMLMHADLQKPTVKVDGQIKDGIASVVRQPLPTTAMIPPDGMSAMGSMLTGAINPSLSFSTAPGGALGGLLMLSSNLSQAPEVLAIFGLPPEDVFSEDDMVELLETFGGLRELVHVPFGEVAGVTRPEAQSGMGMAAAVLEGGEGPICKSPSSVVLASFYDYSDALSVRDHLNGWSWGEAGCHRLTVLPGDQIWTQLDVPDDFLKVAAEVDAMSRRLCGSGENNKLTEIPSRCLWLPSILTYTECLDDDRYFDLIEDIEDEIRLFSDVWSLKVPRPTAKALYPEETIRGWTDLSKAVDIPVMKEEEEVATPFIPLPPASDETTQDDVNDQVITAMEKESGSGIESSEVIMKVKEEAGINVKNDTTEENQDDILLDQLPFDPNDSDVGHCFIEFATVADATRIRNLFTGRTYNHRSCMFHYFDEQHFIDNRFTNPSALYNIQGSSLFSKCLKTVYAERAELVKQERDEKRLKDVKAIELREEAKQKERNDERRLAAEAELMAAEELARQMAVRESALVEMKSTSVGSASSLSTAPVAAGANIAAAQTSGTLVKDDDSDMGCSDD